MRRRSGSALLETALLAPILLSLAVGTAELARVTYTYYMLQKVMYNLARYLGTQQGVNFCDTQDAVTQAAINFALTGTSDGSGTPVVAGLTPGMVQVSIERYDQAAEQLLPCECSAAGCDAGQGGLSPDFLVVSLTDGYSVRPVFLGFSVAPLQLRPRVKVPYAGT